MKEKINPVAHLTHHESQSIMTKPFPCKKSNPHILVDIYIHRIKYIKESWGDDNLQNRLQTSLAWSSFLPKI